MIAPATLFLSFLLLMSLPLPANAAAPGHGNACGEFAAGANACNAGGCFVCTGGNWVDQPLYFGTSSATCDAGHEGLQRYNSTAKITERCDGTSWIGPMRIQLSTILTTCNSSYQGQLRYVAGATIWDQETIEYCNGSSWQTFAPLYCADFSNLHFTSVTGQTISTLVTSDIIQVTGGTCTQLPISLSGTGSPQYRVCSDAACTTVVTDWTSAASTVALNNYIQLRVTTSASGNTAVSATLRIDVWSLNWSATTEDYKYIFVTSTTYNGNLKGANSSGITGADANCAARATAAGLSGTYKAWIATTAGNDPANLLYHASGPYKLLNVGHTAVANNWTDLVSGTLLAAINIDESGNTVSAANNVWSNVSSAGARVGSTNCSNWTSSASGSNGRVGSSNATSSTWSNSAQAACNGTMHLYCLQQ